MEKESIDLYTLQEMLKAGVEAAVPGRFWLRAEVSAIKARRGGHCYLELSQSGPSGLVAKVQAIIWASTFRFLEPFFASVAGAPLAEGMQILVNAQVSYSELYGMSLIINDIDPEFSLGAREAERQKTIARLKEEGLMDMQQRLSLAPLPYNLAVISAPDAAGYRDFTRHLEDNAYGFVFRTELFPALMQGAGCPESIAAAIAKACGSPFDAILIMRGGGAKLDMDCYDDYVLAAAIARCPIPVFTAVGHDQDHHICDMVSWCSVKTPTALADEFIERFAEEDERISSYASRLRTAFLYKIASMEAQIQTLHSRILSADPRNVLRRGYILAADERGVVLKSAEKVEEGDNLSLMFADGTLRCRVLSKDRK